MAEGQPIWNQTLCYNYNELRSLANVCVEGVIDVFGGSLLVASTAAADHSVTVAAGAAWVEADGANVEGMYRISNDALITLQLDAGNGVNPRIDTIVATVRDSQSSGTDDDWVAEVLDGTPTAGANLTNLNGAAAVPDMTLVLGYVLVGSADTLTTTISAANVLDFRRPYTSCGSVEVPRTRWARTTNQSLNDNTATTITYPAGATGSAVPNAYYSETGGVVTFRVPGVYAVAGQIDYAAGGATAPANTLRRSIQLLQNGSTVAEDSGPAIQSVSVPTVKRTAAFLSVGAGDTLRIDGLQASGGAVNVTAASLTVTYIGSPA